MFHKAKFHNYIGCIFILILAIFLFGCEDSGYIPPPDGGGITGNAGEAAKYPSTNSDGTVGQSYGDPVDTGTGAHVLKHTLVRLNGAQPLVFNIQYNSLLLQEDIVGRGWSHNYETHLNQLTSGAIEVCWNGNSRNTFINSEGNTYISSDFSVRFDRLIKESDNSYSLIRKDHSKFIFNSNGLLLKVENGHGQSIELVYDNSGHLTTVTEPVSGQLLNLVYNAEGLLAKATDTINREVSFDYDTNHNLIKITDTKGDELHYTYNEIGRVLTGDLVSGEETIPIFIDQYDEKGRILSQDDGVDGNSLSYFSYDETSQPGIVITKITDRNGNKKSYGHDRNYQLHGEEDELGNRTQRNYDKNNNCIFILEPDNHKTQFTYDSRGNVLKTSDQVGVISTMKYDQKDNLTTIANAEGKRILYTYDENNNLVSYTDPLGNISEYTYDENGLMLTKTAPGKGTTSYTYEKGLVKTVTDPTGITTTFNYDKAGRLIQIVDALGHITEMSYDSADNVISKTDPLGNMVSFSYDSRGNVLTETDALGNTTQYSYNGNGKLVSKMDPMGNLTVYEYDGEDRLTKTTDPKGNSTSFTYDAKGRIVCITDPIGNYHTLQYDVTDNVVSEFDAYNTQVQKMIYDKRGNLNIIGNALNNEAYYDYDSMDRLISSTDPRINTTLYSYDDMNRLISATDQLEGSSAQSFDTGGNRVSITDPNGNQMLFTYDNAGRLLSITSPAGKAISYKYDELGQLSEITDGSGDKTLISYDPAGRMIRFTDPVDTVSYNYNANGQIEEIKDSTGTISRDYDELNRVVQYSDVEGNILSYAYDDVGNLTTLTYPDGRQVSYEYNEANQMIGVTDWAGRKTFYEYDKNGRLIKTENANGTVSNLSYDIAGQITERKDEDASGNRIIKYSYKYDTGGYVIEESKNDAESLNRSEPITTLTAISASQNITMTYGADNRLSVFNGEAVEYDPDGNMIRGPINGDMTGLSFDARNRLIGAGDLTYLYDAENNRTGVLQNGNKISYIVNTNAQLSQVLVKKDSVGEETYYIYGLGLIGQENSDGAYLTYHYDRRGSTVALTDETGATVEQFAYGPYGELEIQDKAPSTQFLYNGRDGVMTDTNGLYYMRARYYSPDMKRFINQDVITGTIDNGQSLNQYAYVNGQPINYIDPFGLSPIDNMYSYRTQNNMTWNDAKELALYFGDKFINNSKYKKMSAFNKGINWGKEITGELPSSGFADNLDFIDLAFTKDKPKQFIKLITIISIRNHYVLKEHQTIQQLGRYSYEQFQETGDQKYYDKVIEYELKLQEYYGE